MVEVSTVTIDIDGKQAWPIPSRHAAVLVGATKNEDGSVTYQYIPLEPGKEHSLLVRVEPEEIREIVRAWRVRPGDARIPTNEELSSEIERRIERKKLRARSANRAPSPK